MAIPFFGNPFKVPQKIGPSQDDDRASATGQKNPEPKKDEKPYSTLPDFSQEYSHQIKNTGSDKVFKIAQALKYKGVSSDHAYYVAKYIIYPNRGGSGVTKDELKSGLKEAVRNNKLSKDTAQYVAKICGTYLNF